MTFDLTGVASDRIFVGYYRVSTGKQYFSGLGLDAQRADVRNYVGANHGRLIGEYSETASGRKSTRPQLKAALTLCRITGATLAVARLDRLSRSVELVTSLMESGLDFVTIDFPEANRFTIQILSAVAEYEAGIQSERMKAIIAVKLARKVDGGMSSQCAPARFPPGCQRASALVRQARADARARDLAPLVQKAVCGGKSYGMIAAEFNDLGIRPPQQAPWTKNSIWRIVCRVSDGTGSKPLNERTPRVGAAQVRVINLLDEIGSVLKALREQAASYAAIADELDRRGIRSPRGLRWGPASIRRYMMRSLGVPALRDQRVAAI